MTRDVITLGPALFTSDGSRAKYKQIISKLDLKPPVIIKPNWSSSMAFTESKLLDWTLSAIDSETIIVESHAVWRCQFFLEFEGHRDTAFLTKLRRQTRKQFRDNDKWFLNFSKMQEVLDRYDVQYLNLSEELWAGRLGDPSLVQDEVEKKFGPLQNKSLYSLVPQRLLEMRGGTLLSLAKPKRSLSEKFVSLTLKNMFGMIPSPWRGKYHGENDCYLSRNIIDISKVYLSLFSTRGIIEGVFSTSETVDNVAKPKIHQDMGVIWGGRNLLELDALVCSQMGLNPNEVDYLSLAYETLGEWSDHTVKLGFENLVDFPS
ncbi:MAG: DUF362 domain-containing protein [Candidatus Thorarchaeota archaeon]|nr:DUF362 domain-containing protein [Candidatus Thorarchaeota archaeon]